MEGPLYWVLLQKVGDCNSHKQLVYQLCALTAWPSSKYT
jgi:hypothetical protein